MITTEQGFTFSRDGDSWRCLEHPALRMYADGSYGIEGEPHRYPSASRALAELRGEEPAAAPQHTRRSRATRGR